jgi:hypothetical protein
MRTYSSHALTSGEVIARFFVRMIVIVVFAAVAGIGFAPGLAMLLWMSTLVSAGIAALRRELPLARALNHWDEAAASIALGCLVESVSRVAA